jgi:hypothetical protein
MLFKHAKVSNSHDLANTKMNRYPQKTNGCCSNPTAPFPVDDENLLQPLSNRDQLEEMCCGSLPEPESSRFERPGYALLHFVEGFVDTPGGAVPRVKTVLQQSDFLGMLNVRLGLKRNQYKVAPGLYCVGSPNPNSAVLVTANYKLTFDVLRKELASINAWILVLDTRGINVWCSAGKDLFSTKEVVHRVKLTGLKNVVTHNQLILPQLAATGVAAHEVKKESGFEVIWGPVRAKDINLFLENGLKSQRLMRQVTFSLTERLAVIPVELVNLPKPTLWILVAVFLISGVGTNVFSLSSAWSRGLMLSASYAGGILAGAVAAPVLLPWIPGRSFALKGTIVGCIAGCGIAAIFLDQLQIFDALALILCTTAVSSYLAMNFTGSTPFTSPSGVEKEMRRAIPMQVMALLIVIAAWIGSAFVG